MTKKYLFFLYSILIAALTMRLFGINWDQGFNLHPDERAIILFTLPLHFPISLQQFFSINSPLNPHFFAYGSLPLYLLKIVSSAIVQITHQVINYNNIAIIGRVMSAIADTVTVLLVFLIAKKISSFKAALFAALCYACATFAIQVSHFYAVDTLLTCFITCTLFLLILFYDKPTFWKSFLIGLFFGLALATKDSALVLLAAIGVTLAADFFLIFSKENRTDFAKKQAKHIFLYGGIICFTTLIIFLIFEPYAVIDFSNFWLQTMQQSQMTRDAFTFPYTLQYVGIIPYLYELQNIFLWGLGPVITLLAGIGLCVIGKTIYQKRKNDKWAHEVILLIFFFAYFFVVGKFAVGFMRYMLPVYPILAICAGIGITFLLSHFSKKIWVQTILIIYLLLLIAYWPLSFLRIYTKPNTRVQATEWILAHVPPGSSIAVEHWDDSLPLLNQQEYTMHTLPLYDPDTQVKWQQINATLAKTNYIIIASNRLYVPLQKLADCTKFPPPHCYPLTTLYYQKLFSGQLGFTQVAQFTQYPIIPFSNIQINDQAADESFTVYDHPKVMVFKKTP